jgi:hypothetical protein
LWGFFFCNFVKEFFKGDRFSGGEIGEVAFDGLAEPKLHSVVESTGGSTPPKESCRFCHVFSLFSVNL